MSERFQKTFISVREFVESWDKELYELNNLDFFIYLMINHLGNQLEKRFFTHERRLIQYYLDFDQIGTLCFNLGDEFEFFLQENCLGSCNLNCPRDLDSIINLKTVKLDEKHSRKLALVQAFLSNEVEKEQFLRIDLMNYVILDTLIQFYSEEFQVELSEDDLFLHELAEFIEDSIIEFMRLEGQSLLHKPFETAIEYFEELLQNEVEEETENDWQESGDFFEPEFHKEEWQKFIVAPEEVFTRFLSDQRYSPVEQVSALTYDISFLKKYLAEYAQLDNIYDFSDYHLREFFSFWLVKEFVLSDPRQIPHIFRATARFVTFLYQNYNINLKRDFLKIYEALKTNLIRVIEATNQFLAEYDLLEALLSGSSSDAEQISGIFEIARIHPDNHQHLDLIDIQFSHRLDDVSFPFSAARKLRSGDVLQATLLNEDDSWKITEIQYIFPAMGRPFIRF